MIKKFLLKFENPEQPLLGPNIKALRFWGMILPKCGWLRYFYILIYIVNITFIVTEYIDVWFVKEDIKLLLKNLKITILASVSLIKVLTFLYWQKYWKQITKYVTRADLNQRATTDKAKLELISKFMKYCRIITYSYWFLMYLTVALIVAQPICKYISSPTYRVNVKNGTEMYLQVVNSWVPFDKTNLVGYLAACTYQSYASFYGGCWVIYYDTLAVVIMVFFRLELELIKIESSEIFGSEKDDVGHVEAKKRLKSLHNRHMELLKYARLFDSCLSPIMFLYLIVCSIVLCITAYHIQLEPEPIQKIMLSVLLVFGVAQLLTFCWHSNDVFYASLALSRGPYESVWWARNAKYRKDLLILTTQFSHVIVFSAGPFIDLNVATFINIMKGAYSYYTLLSQSQTKNES